MCVCVRVCVLCMPYKNTYIHTDVHTYTHTRTQLILAPCVLVWSVLLHRTLRVSPANTYLAYGVSLVLGGMAAAIVNVTSRRNQPPGYVNACGV